MFEKSVNDTVRLISRQVTQVETKVPGRPACRVTVNSIPLHSFLTGFEPILMLSPKNVFLAGGFAENPYLFNQVKEYTDSTSHIHLQRADDWFVNSL
jgi:hypothetical protein